MRSILFAMTLFLVAAAVCFSTPSTQIWIPSTDIQGFLNPHLGWDVYHNVNGEGLVSNGGLTIGVLPLKKIGMEIGVDYRDINGTHGNPIYFNAKVGIPEKAFGSFSPSAAIGGFDFGVETPNRYNLVYGLVGKTIGKAGRFSIGGYKGGVGSQKELFVVVSKGYDNATGAPLKIADGGLIASWDRTLSEVSDKLWLAVDYQGGGNAYGAVSFGLSWLFAPNAGVLLGYDIYNDSDVLKPTLTLQFDLNLF